MTHSLWMRWCSLLQRSIAPVLCWVAISSSSTRACSARMACLQVLCRSKYPNLPMCVCVCVFARTRAHVCVCVWCLLWWWWYVCACGGGKGYLSRPRTDYPAKETGRVTHVAGSGLIQGTGVLRQGPVSWSRMTSLLRTGYRSLLWGLSFACLPIVSIPPR